MTNNGQTATGVN